METLDVLAATDEVEDEPEVLKGPVGEVAGVAAVGSDPRQTPEAVGAAGRSVRAASRSIVDASVTCTSRSRPRVSVRRRQLGRASWIWGDRRVC